MTVDELKAKRAALQDALDLLMQGKASAEVRYGELSQKFHQADIAALERRIADLQQQIDRAEGVSRGGFVVG